MPNEINGRSAGSKRASPFARAAGTGAMTFEASGRGLSGVTAKSMESLLRQIGIARPTPGGNDDVEDPLADSWAVAACVEKWKQAVRGGPVLRVWESGSPDAKEVPEGHPLRALLAGPVPYMGSGDLLEASIVHYLLSGEDWQFLMDGDGKPLTSDVNPKAKIPLPRWILPVSGEFVSDKRETKFGRIEFASYGGETRQVWFPLGSTFQIRNYNRKDPQRGLAPLDAAMRAVSVGFQAERFQEGVMRAGGPGAYLHFEEEMSPEEERRVTEEHNESIRDPDVLGGVKVISGKGTITPNPATPKEMLPTATLDWSRNVICSVLGVPPPVIGVFDDATYENVRESYRQFWSNVKCWLDAWATKFNEGLVARLNDAKLAGCRISFDFSGVQALQVDNTAKFTAAKDLATSGAPVSMATAALAMGLEVDLGKEAETIMVPAGFVPFDPDAGADVGSEAQVPSDVAVQDTGLNGAQIDGILAVLLAISEGRLTVESAIALLQVAFPGIDAAEASAICNGALEKEPEPEPAPFGGGAPADDEPAADPAEDEDKALPQNRALPPLTDPAERAAYSERVIERVMAAPERELRTALIPWFERYEAEQIRVIEEFAEHGPQSRALPAVERDYGFSEEIERFLLLIDEAWAAELGALSRAPLHSAFVGALDDIASELSVVQISATDPRVAQALAAQQIRLAEGVTSRLAETVKQTILESLANPGGNAAAPLQLQIRDRLPELTEDLRKVFGTKEARASTIARTETASAVGNARELQMDEAGVQETQWVASNDDATRESHRELDGQVRRRGDEFKPGLKRPHDPNAPVSEIANCRCTTKAILP